MSLNPVHVPPWRSISSQTAYENNWIRLAEHNVVRPDGSFGLYGVVETKATAATIVAVHGSRVCMIREYRFPLRDFIWRFPTGGAVATTSTLDAAMRELREETAYVAADWSMIGRCAPMSGLSSEIADVYLAQALTRKSDRRERDIVEVAFVDRMQLTRMIQASAIIDGQTLAALAIVDAIKPDLFR